MHATMEANTSANALEDLDVRLLNLIQKELPLMRRPFGDIASKLGIDEADAIDRVQRLKGAAGTPGIIRQISAIFDSRSLGYVSSLVAAKVDENHIDEAAAEVGKHPGVSHNYRRDHPFNLWYTIAVPPDSLLGLQKTVDELHRRSGASITRLLPTLKVYKIGVKFSLGEADAAAREEAEPSKFGAAEGFAVTESDKRMIRVLQQDLPIVAEPFELWAKQAGVAVDELIRSAKAYIENGAMRRFSAVLRHRQAGFSANAMGAWAVPEAQQEAFGNMAASFTAVSHCYLRPAYPPDWPFSIFTMVHGKTRDECEAVLSEISRASAITRYTALYSTHEYKKIRVKYFAGDIEAWEADAIAR